MTQAVTIWHNPACGTSRNVLAMIRAAGVEPTVVEYLTAPPTRAGLARAIADSGLTPRRAVREKEALFAELRLDDPDVTVETILDAMLAHPVLIDRPFVFTTRGVRLCRPCEVVLEILPAPLADFTKENGEVVNAGKAS